MYWEFCEVLYRINLLSLNGRIPVSENPYSRKFYTVDVFEIVRYGKSQNYSAEVFLNLLNRKNYLLRYYFYPIAYTL